MEKEAIINYYSTYLNDTESIMIYEDKIIYIKSNLNITSQLEDMPSNEKRIEIKDRFFVNSIILGNIYMPMKQSMIDICNKVNNMDIKELHRPKNTAHKNITINDKEFVANIDMYVQEIGTIFDDFINRVKKTLMLELNK